MGHLYLKVRPPDAQPSSPRGPGFSAPTLSDRVALYHTQIHNWAESGNRLSLPVCLGSEPLMEPLSVYYVHAWLLLDTQRLKQNYPIRYVSPFKITQRHRIDAELFYLSRTARESYLSDAARNAAHPRWVELCERESCSKR